LIETFPSIMSGFEDDFGEMVEPVAIVPTLVGEVNNTTTGSGLDDLDPAAAFLAREHEQLGELEEEIGSLSVSMEATAGSRASSRGAGLDLRKVKEEPAVIREWREKQVERLRIKDEEEEEARTQLKQQAAKELSDWYVQYADQLERLRATNRDARKTEDKTFVAAPFQPVEPGTEWERVAKLCDFNPKSAKNVKDVSRMRSILLQLKQTNNGTVAAAST